jgi:hypothetical protein
MTRHVSVFRTWAVAIVVVLCCTLVFGQSIPLKNWTVGKKLTISANADISNPGVFVAVNPCRVVDTRNPTGTYGGPALVGGASRSFNIPAGPCAGIPANPSSFSLNFTIVNATGPNGFLTAYPTGTTRPVASTMNYTTNTTIANAAIVPPNASGSIDVYVNVSTDAIIDINGYFLDRNGLVNAGESLGVVANVSGNGAIKGQNLNSGGYGVWGQANTGTGIGVYGTSANYNGMWAQSTNWDGIASFGGRDGGYFQGARYGVVGVTTATTGALFGVVGSAATAATAGAAGVEGSVGSTPDTSGLLGETASASGFTGTPGFFAVDVGVKGRGARGVIGAGTSLGGAFIHVTGTASDAYAYFGSSSTQAITAIGNANITGNLAITGSISKGSGTFMIDHPLDPANKYLYHSFVESPDMMNIYNGVVQLDANGEATVQLPDYFGALNQDFRYQLTAMGRSQPNLYIADEVSYNMFRIAGGRPNGKVSWTVTGIRHDEFANAHRIIPEVMKPEAERGFYVYPVEHGQTLTKSIDAAYAKTDEEKERVKSNEAARLRELQKQ